FNVSPTVFPGPVGASFFILCSVSTIRCSKTEPKTAAARWLSANSAFTPTLKFDEKTIGNDFAALSITLRCSGECPVVPMTSGLRCRNAAPQISSIEVELLKSIATSQFLIAGSIASPRSHCATMSILGSFLARSTIVGPFDRAPRSASRAPEISFCLLECFEGLAQSRLIRVRHFAKGQTNFGSDRPSLAEHGFDRHWIRLDEQILELREHFAVQTFRRFVIARFPCAHERANFHRK